MNELKNAAETFLSLKNIAIVGVSSRGDTAANIIYKKLSKLNYTLFAVNPNAKTIDGNPCYPRLESIPEKIDGVIIGTAPDVTPQIIDDCTELGIKYIWIHRSFGQGSFHPEAIKKAEDHNISLIPGGCPMMFSDPVDPAHKCMRWFLNIAGKESRPIGFEN